MSSAERAKARLGEAALVDPKDEQGIRVVFSLVLVYALGWWMAGLWCAVATDQFLRSYLIYQRFKKGLWKRIKV
ncbi:hypothetical protein [Paenibacillus puerhi]|uniref:hypothetical protein n=1 Tax=Paenibacillus puerhi TaxID=2692622 RepID=UPI001356D79F|nr:hypothetical protein [Paenibacillus puerhi]